MDCMKDNQFNIIKSQVHSLVMNHPEGIWFSELFRLYREQFEELVQPCWGVMSIVRLLNQMPDVVAMSGPHKSGDWLVYDSRVPPPARGHPFPQAAPARNFPTVDWFYYDSTIPYQLPENFMSWMESLPPIPISDLERSTMVHLKISKIHSPLFFWINRLGDEHYTSMQQMRKDMVTYYGIKGCSQLKFPPVTLRKGMYCACLYNDIWHRAFIARVIEMDTAEVFLVDLGKVLLVEKDKLRPLSRRWATLPRQAILGRMFGVKPDGEVMAKDTSIELLTSTQGKHLAVIVSNIDLKRDELEVFLMNSLVNDPKLENCTCTSPSDNVVYNIQVTMKHNSKPEVALTSHLLDSPQEEPDFTVPFPEVRIARSRVQRIITLVKKMESQSLPAD